MSVDNLIDAKHHVYCMKKTGDGDGNEDCGPKELPKEEAFADRKKI